MNGNNPEARWFGDRQIDPAEKTSMVREVFSSVASSYDIMNDVMSLGIHRLWKKRFVDRIAPRDGEMLLDVAGGTGDVALRMAARAPKASIAVCDFNPAMLGVGRDRAIDCGKLGIDWVVGNAQTLPFPTRHFNAYTIAFGLRNVAEIDTALAEAFRVLKHGGRFFCLEFSRIQVPVFDRLYDLYSRTAIPAMGGVIAKDRSSYEYLVESIRRFPSQAELARRIEAAGFGLVTMDNLSGGIACIHSGYRL